VHGSAPELTRPHRAAEVTSTHLAKMTTGERATSTATVRSERIGRDASASHYHHYGNDDRHSAQQKFLHGISFLLV
jgi:hypothetical protein